MKILALDTATPIAGIALLDGGRLVGEVAVPAERGHAGHLLSSVRFLLERSGWPTSAPDLFVATSGPGSFTGLRIGLGTIEGLALAAGRRDGLRDRTRGDSSAPPARRGPRRSVRGGLFRRGAAASAGRGAGAAAGRPRRLARAVLGGAAPRRRPRGASLRRSPARGL